MEKYQDNFELEEMKQQIRLLKDKLAKETIISEKMMMQSTREKLTYINRNKRLMYIGIPFALIYCNMFFIWMNYSWMFCVVTSLFLIAACLYQIYSHRESICIGGGVGFVAGAIIGLRYLKNERRKAKEAIRDIEEYTRED